ncbi:MAG: ChrR family anti-sigma-E factor [Proteobacteria bacterium]|nr:ChrR family anti-sigma-E factor [Pseudomonadota bacterium]
MSGQHHPSLEILGDYAAGGLPEPVALALAVHLSSCSVCRIAAQRLEVIGGVVLDDVPPAALDTEAALDRALSNLDDAKPADHPSEPGDLPHALLRRLPGDLATLPWRRVARGVAEFALDTYEAGYRAKLLRIQPGASVPRHTHGGEEYTVVLAGAFNDSDVVYDKGDFAEADPTVRHQPVATDDDVCYCLAVTNAPLKLLGPIGRLIDPLLRLRAQH